MLRRLAALHVPLLSAVQRDTFCSRFQAWLFILFHYYFIRGKWGLDPRLQKLADLRPHPTQPQSAHHWHFSAAVTHWSDTREVMCGISSRQRRCGRRHDATCYWVPHWGWPIGQCWNRYPDWYQISKFNIRINENIDINITTAVQGHPRSSILVPIESPYVTSY